MKRDCQKHWEEIVALAEGRHADQAQSHLDGCPACREKFDQLVALMGAFRHKVIEAPEMAVQRAKDLMPNRVSRLVLVRSSLQYSTARAADQDFQAVFAGPDLEMRVMYTKLDSGWQVMGKLPDQGWSVHLEAGSSPDVMGGRFQFVAASIDSTGFSVEHDGARFEVPSASEAIRDSRRDS